MRPESQMPIYQIIALDLANRIYAGEFKEGDKIYGRSTLASEYNVSPETIRKSIKILEDVNIVKSEKGSGVTISSRENALIFIRRFTHMKSLKELEQDARALIEERAKLDRELTDIITKILHYVRTLRNTNPLSPVEVEITENCRFIGKTVGEVKFWENTGGTIVGIKRRGKLILSPGPHADFQLGDILLIIGDENILDRVNIFLEKN